MKKIISIVLTVSLLLSICAAGASAISPVKTSCGGQCGNYPTIIVPGIGQSNVWLLDDNGDYELDADGERINCFPAYFPVAKIIGVALVPVLLTLITQHNIGLRNALSKIVTMCFGMNMSDNNGKCLGNVEVEKYPYSLAECSDYEKDQIYNNVPISECGINIGEDHLYYFAYNSFGNNIAICDELYEFIQQVKRETGHDKVNIVPISLGGTIANGLLEYHPEVYNDLHKVIYIIPALDGSTIVGDVFKKDVTFLDKNQLYHTFLEGLMEESQAKLIEVALRIFPDELLMDVLNDTCDLLIENVLINCTNMWALVPSKDYPALAAKYLSTPDKAEIRRQTERYYQAQLNSDANILKLKENGVQVFDIVDYDFPLYNIGNSWNADNADGVIHLDSTSMGTHSARCGETLPAGYTQKNTNCSNPMHNHISPDNVIDASAGLLPDYTFYFDGQGHEGTGRNDIIMTLATALISSDDIENVYSDPNFPQFNIGRETKSLRRSDLPNAKKALENINAGTVAATAEQKARLEKAINDCEAMLKRTIAVEGEAEALEAELEAALCDIGVYGEDKGDPTFGFAYGINSFLDKWYGTNGFSEMPLLTILNIFRLITGIFTK